MSATVRTAPPADRAAEQVRATYPRWNVFRSAGAEPCWYASRRGALPWRRRPAGFACTVHAATLDGLTEKISAQELITAGAGLT